MPNTPDFIAHVLELMRPTAPALARAMFGGHGIYAGGPIVAIVIDDILYFKSDEVNRGEFTALALEPFVYKTRAGVISAMSYRRAPDDALDSPEAMRRWLRSAEGAALRSASAKSTRARTGAKAAPKAHPPAKRRNRATTGRE
jgi:DNA transformation protein